MSGFTLDDIELTNGTAGTFSGNGAAYSVRVTPNEGFAGDVIVTVPAGSAFDAERDGNLRSSRRFPVNMSAPRVTIESWDDFPADGPFDVTITFLGNRQRVRAERH